MLEIKNVEVYGLQQSLVRSGFPMIAGDIPVEMNIAKEKDKKSAVDEREEARYGPEIKIKKVEEKYEETMNLCRRAISQTEEIIYSNKKYEIPKELL